jgi:signal transduction histidine kinase/ActR/RegA family two-component response regulator
MAQVLDLAEPVKPALATTAGAALYQRFECEPDVLAIAVVDPLGRPVGIVERNSFFLRMAAEYGRALYAQRPISVLMNACPVIVDASASLSTFTGEVLAERPSELMQGFVVVKDGFYVGMGSALGLLQATSRANHAHAVEMTRLAQTLEAAQAETQAALRAKSQFLAVMSHEIRTPLNGVLSIAEILARRLQQPELQPYVRTILDSGETLLRLLTDALDVSRMDAGQLDLKQASFRLKGVVEDVSNLWGAKAAERGLNWRVEYDGPDDLRAVGDEVRLKQVLNNLAGNALKFTEAGEVSVRLQARAENDHVRIHCEIRDTGMGVPEPKLKAIFQPFIQDEAGRALGGAGLGLSICRELVERMGGTIHAESNAGGGLAMVFGAVLGQAPAEGVDVAIPAPDDLVLPPLHVLVADDNATNRLVAETLCAMFGCTSESVEDGAQAVDAALAGAFDLILMDIKMPVMGGLAATRHIRESGHPSAADLPIVALTANADPRDAEGYLAAGMDAVVEKPIKPALLLAAMLKAAQTHGAARAWRAA